MWHMAESREGKSCGHSQEKVFLCSESIAFPKKSTVSNIFSSSFWAPFNPSPQLWDRREWGKTPNNDINKSKISSAAKNNNLPSQSNSFPVDGSTTTPVFQIQFTQPNSVTVSGTHRIPFGIHLLLLELGKLPSVMNDHQQLPDEQQGQANQDNASDHACHDGDDVRTGGAVWNRVGCSRVFRTMWINKRPIFVARPPQSL